MKTKISQKCLSLLLSLCLVVTMMPTVAFAQQAEEAASTYAASDTLESSGRITGKLYPEYGKTQYYVGDTIV